MPRWVYPVLAAILGAGLYFLGAGLHPIWPFIWLAPIPVLFAAFHVSAATAAAVAFAAFFCGGFNIFSYLTSVAPVSVAIGVLFIPALAFTASIIITRRVVLRFKQWTGIFVFPAIWTSYEFLLALISPHGTFGSLAYTQMDFLPVIQIASLTGLWGVTFLVTLIPSGVAVAWNFRNDKQQAMPALVTSLALGVMVLGFGWIRLAQPVVQSPIHAGLAVTDTTVQYFETEAMHKALPVVNAYARRIREATVQGATVVVLPEKFVGVTASYKNEMTAILAEVAKESGVVVVAGWNQIAADAKRNTAVVFSPDGQIFAEYDKRHLVPVWEAGYQPGDSPHFFSIAQVKCGVAICKDMDFPELGREYSCAGVGLMLIPAWDFGRDAWLHARMAVMRGVEGGYAIVRCAQEGMLTVSDHCGRVLAEKRSSAAGEVILVSEVCPGVGQTLYSATGNWLGWANVILALFAVVVSLVRGFQKAVIRK